MIIVIALAGGTDKEFFTGVVAGGIIILFLGYSLVEFGKIIKDKEKRMIIYKGTKRKFKSFFIEAWKQHKARTIIFIVTLPFFIFLIVWVLLVAKSGA